MSELFDKLMIVQKRLRRKLLGFTQAPASPLKVCENERKYVETKKK